MLGTTPQATDAELDLVVGIPSFNEAATIGHVIDQADSGLREYLPDERSLIVNADNASTDGTRGIVTAARTVTPTQYVSTLAGVRGKGTNVANILRIARERYARAVVLLDADLGSVAPTWVRDLAGPVIRGQADVVMPIYRTSQGGPLTNLLVRPLVAGLLGGDVPQPIGGEIALSRRFASAIGSELPREAQGYGIDIFLTTEAQALQMRVEHVDLGVKRHRVRPWSTIAPIAREVVTMLLVQVDRHGVRWTQSPPPSPSPTCMRGAPESSPGMSGEPPIDRDALALAYEKFRRQSPDLAAPAGKITADEWPAILCDVLDRRASEGWDASDTATQLVGLLHGRMLGFASEARDPESVDALVAAAALRLANEQGNRA